MDHVSQSDGKAFLQGCKVYDEARSAHLERVAAGQQDGGTNARLVYRKVSYDFDDTVGREIGGGQKSLWGIFRHVAGGNFDCIEVNEPFFLRALPTIVAALLGGTVARWRNGRRPLFVTYAIENIDMAAKLRSHALLGGVTVAATRLVLRGLVGRMDRIAFGTLAARQGYERLLGHWPERVETSLFTAVEPPCPDCPCAKETDSVLFLGAFDDRKGIAHVMRAWPAVVAQRPGARLNIIGKGPLAYTVSNWAALRDEVSLSIDPPRAQIHASLSRAKVLVLPSIASLRWIEQVGLPIVEGLQHGCVIVTSRDTGLSGWLIGHGHYVLDDPADAAALGRGLLAALGSTMQASAVRATLPSRSGRVEAEEWLWRA